MHICEENHACDRNAIKEGIGAVLKSLELERGVGGGAKWVEDSERYRLPGKE